MATKALSALTTAVLALDDSVPFTDTSDANATKKAVGIPVVTPAQIAAGATGVPGVTAAGVVSNLAGQTVATLTNTAATLPGTLSLNGDAATLSKPATNTWQFANGTSTQTANFYNTLNGANSEYLTITCESNIYKIDNRATGTGARRNMYLQAANLQLHGDSCYFVSAGATISFGFSTASSAGGICTLIDSSGSNFNRINLGGTSASYPGIKRNGTTIDFRLANDSAFTDIQARNVIENPVASLTLSTNGQYGVEMTSNTAGNLVYRGSDGVTRRAALTFV